MVERMRLIHTNIDGSTKVAHLETDTTVVKRPDNTTLESTLVGLAKASVPVGGSTSQALVKESDEDNDTTWKTLTASDVGAAEAEHGMHVTFDNTILPVTTGATGAFGTANTVSRSDHVHPTGTMLRVVEDEWGQSAITNLIPTTPYWVMSNGAVPTLAYDYDFEATFGYTWEAFSCFFDEGLLTLVRGKTVKFGITTLEGTGCRLEMIVDGTAVGAIYPTNIAKTETVSIPLTATSITLRVIIWDTDKHCKFTGVTLYDKAEEDALKNGASFFMVRKVLRIHLPTTGVAGTLYITEAGDLYLAQQDGSLLPLGGSPAANSTMSVENI